MTIKEKKTLTMSVTIAFIVLSVIFLLGAWWRVIQHNNLEEKQKADTAMLAKVDKLLDLPSESPIITTIRSKEDFKNENFYSKIEAGDKIIIYLNEDQAIFYRPSTNTVTLLLPVTATIKSYK